MLKNFMLVLWVRDMWEERKW